MNFKRHCRIETLEKRALLFVPIGQAGDVMPVIDEQVIEVGESVSVADSELLEFTELRIEGNMSVSGDIIGQTIFVAPGGRLELLPGASLTIADVAIDVSEDPHQIGNGILVAGQLDVRGTEKTAFARLATDAVAGRDHLFLERVPTDWSVGDTLAIADTRQLLRHKLDYELNLNSSSPKYTLRPRGGYQHETMVIAEISNNSILLEHPLEYDHLGLEGQFPHVANLTRDIVIQSENPAGTRGHLIGFSGSTMSFVGAQIDDFGRTTVDVLDNAVVEGSLIEHVGENQTGRYPVHFHHVGTSGTSELRGAVINGSPKWGIGVHGTHYINVQNNVVWQAKGAGIVVEDGNETGLQIRDNYTGASDGSGEAIDGRKKDPNEFAFEGSGIWLQGVSKTVVEGNVSEGNQSSQFAVFQFTPSERELRFPKFVGADLSNPSHFSSMAQKEMRFHGTFDSFSNNIAAGGRRGFEFWSLLTDNVFEDLVSWNTSHLGLAYFYATNPPEIRDSQFYADPSIDEGAIALSHQGLNSAGDFIVTRVLVSGFSIGLNLLPTSAGKAVGKTEVKDAVFRDNDFDLVIQNPEGEREVKAEIDGLISKVQLKWGESSRVESGQTPQTIVINGLTVYFDEQDRDFVVPNNRLFDFPGEGVTNQDLVDAGRQPTLGRLAPSNASKTSWLHGGKASPIATEVLPPYKPPRQEIVPSLKFNELNTLQAGDEVYLTLEQLQSIPNAYWFSTIPESVRHQLDRLQVANLSVSSRRTIEFLSQEQRAWLSAHQVQSLKYQDFPFLNEHQVVKLLPTQIEAIPDAQAFVKIPETVRAAMTGNQVQALNVASPRSIEFLSAEQRSWLTRNQILDIVYTDFRHLLDDQATQLTGSQYRSIPDFFWWTHSFSDSVIAELENSGTCWKRDRVVSSNKDLSSLLGMS